MISWIQNHLIRHGRWIFITLLAIIIVAFVFTIGNTPGCTTNRSGYAEKLFYGYDLNSSHEMEELVKKTQNSIILDTGRPPRNKQQFESNIASRIALLHLADEIGLPTPSKNSLARYIQSKGAFRGPDGQFSRDAYTRFVDDIESNPQVKQDLFVVVLEEDYRIDQIEKVLSGPGYFLKSEALSQVQLNETMLELTTAKISYSNFDSEMKPEEDELIQFYKNNLQRYKIPKRIQASYVKFPTDNYINQASTFSEEELSKHFTTNRARFVAAYKAAHPQKETTDPEEPSSPEVTLEDVRSEVAADLTAINAQKLANQAAQEFALSLYRNDIKRNSPEFQKLLDGNGLNIIEIPPYTAKETKTQALPARMLESAFALSEKRYFSDAYKIKDGFGVLIFSGKLPEEIPEYEAVAEAVKADYRAEEKRHLFNAEGKRLESELSTQIYAGTEFTAAAEALGLNVTKYDSFKVSEAPRGIDPSVRQSERQGISTQPESPRQIDPAVLQRAKGMKEGEISPMITSGDSGIFVYVEKKIVPEIADDDEKLAQRSNFLKRYAEFASSDALLNELVIKGLENEGTSNVER